MPDREKVIKGLEHCSSLDGCKGCPYSQSENGHVCSFNCNNDALTLLKEQEPMKPTWSQGKAYCGKCGQRLPRNRPDKEINYCGYCGQAVKWDESLCCQ